MSKGRKALLKSEPGSIPLACEALEIRGTPNAPAAAADPVLGEGGIGAAKAFYGPSYGIIQNIQNIQDINSRFSRF